VQRSCIDAAVFDVHEDGSGDADGASAADADAETASDATDTNDGADASCPPLDADELCCCDKDAVELPMCRADGSWSCTGAFMPYHGDDCTRPCGPCTFAPSCVDTGADGG
jgi:hypothetical protein